MRVILQALQLNPQASRRLRLEANDDAQKNRPKAVFL
jgi:hypothetical protein